MYNSQFEMGTCCSISTGSTDSSICRIALKLPHGSNGVEWNKNQFQAVNINQWLCQIYAGSSWTGWFCYNDELPTSDHTTKGHCKGILTWNATHIGWLIHSVPRFPHTFTGSTISNIDASELIYGQSFLYVEQARTFVQLEDVIRQILWMKPNRFHTKDVPVVVPYNSILPLEIKRLQWSPTMTHLAKSPNHDTDFIGTELCKLESPWYEESWKRGLEYAPAANVISVENLSVLDTSFTSSQDHSKWATTGKKLWMGDLNHMKSQEKRGGGGMVMTNAALATGFLGLIVKN